MGATWLTSTNTLHQIMLLKMHRPQHADLPTDPSQQEHENHGYIPIHPSQSDHDQLLARQKFIKPKKSA
jgi:hypothetical protein